MKSASRFSLAKWFVANQRASKIIAVYLYRPRPLQFWKLFCANPIWMEHEIGYFQRFKLGHWSAQWLSKPTCQQFQWQWLSRIRGLEIRILILFRLTFTHIERANRTKIMQSISIHATRIYKVSLSSLKKYNAPYTTHLETHGTYISVGSTSFTTCTKGNTCATFSTTLWHVS